MIEGYTHDPLIGTTIGGHYVIDSLIGEGGMGRVYRAHHLRLEGKCYALKVLLGDRAASPMMRIRFGEEAKHTSRLDHPNIVRVLDFGCTPAGLMYLVMELVDGASLGRALASGPMAPARVIRLARELCKGLAHAHARGVIHRDFKPDNILLIGDGTDETPRITDLGLAISVDGDDARLTASGMLLCTPAYAAPEQLFGSTIDLRIDLYALGTAMFEMLTGTLPFGGDRQDLVTHKLTRDAPSVAERAPHVPPALVALVARLLSRDPAGRPPTSTHVFDVLDRMSHPGIGTGPTDLALLPSVEVRREPPRGRARWIEKIVIGAVSAVVLIFSRPWLESSTGAVPSAAKEIRAAIAPTPIAAPPPLDAMPRIAEGRNTAPEPRPTATAGTLEPQHTSARTLIQRGNAELGVGHLGEARRAFQLAIAADHTAHAAFAGLGEVAYNESDYVRAVLEAKRGVALAPSLTSYRMLLARCYYKLMRFEDAIAEWQGVLALDPKHTAARKNIEMTQRKLGQ